MKNANRRILFVLTNHDRLGAAGDRSAGRTGFHLAEASHPWHILRRAGYDIDFASPRGGEAPIDPGSRDMDDDLNRAFLENDLARAQIENTTPIGVVDLSRYDALYFPGGHGTMWDLPDNEDVQEAVRTMFEAGKVVGAVCHGPAALVNVKLSNGRRLVEGKTVSVFTDEEEKAVEKAQKVPFLLARKLVEHGATHARADNFEGSVSVDGNLVTGQNPASARGVGEAMRDRLNGERSEAA